MSTPDANQNSESGFRFDEKYLSQIPALQLLVNLGYQYLPPAEALAARGGKADNVLLEEILRVQLLKLNRIQLKGSQSLMVVTTQKRGLMQKLLTGQWRLPPTTGGNHECS